MRESDLIDLIEKTRREMTPQNFDGKTFDRQLDGKRLGAQYLAVRNLMSDGKSRTLFEISEAIGAPVQSISARLRDLRKPKFGGHIIERRRLVSRIRNRGGTWTYRMVI